MNESLGLQAYTPAGSYHHHFLIVLAFGIWVKVIRLGLQWLASATVHAPPSVPPGHSLAVSEGNAISRRRTRTPSLEQRAKENIGNDAEAPPKQSRSRPSPVSQACEPKDSNELRRDRPQLTVSLGVSAACYEGTTRGLSPLVAQPTRRVQDHADRTTIDDALLPSFTLGVHGSDERAAQDESYVEPSSGEQYNKLERQNRQRLSGTQNVIGLTDRSSAYTRPGAGEPESPSAQSEISGAEQIPPQPLTKSLVSRPLVALSILAVGVEGKNFPSPRLVLEWLGRFLSKDIFQAIAGTDAVRGTIYQKILQTFQNANLPTLVVLYFTGHSYDYDNTFILHDGQSIDENTLLSWIKKIREETVKHLPVVIVLDFCRWSNPNPPVLVEQIEGVYIVWACSLGQSAYDTNLGEDVPCSNFIKAVCLTLNETLSNPACPPAPLLDRVRIWLSQVVKMQRGIICHRAKCQIRWDVCACATCHGGQLCFHSNHDPDEEEPIQRPVVLFPKPEYDISTNQFVQCLRYILGDSEWRKAIQQAAKSILEYRWYKEFIVDLTIGLSNPTGGALQTTDLAAPHELNSLLATSSGPLVTSS
ncbi:hypothetical protein FRC07_008812 [Ceratobasidium sp. 392]|nr:hypothetical protein FRC07_008812 [Ceratobasidium sp. 392]